jgi:hypothetical protein
MQGTPAWCLQSSKVTGALELNFKKQQFHCVHSSVVESPAVRKEVDAVCAAWRSLTVPQPSRDRPRDARLCLAAR